MVIAPSEKPLVPPSNAMWLAERDDINSIFMQMLPLRHQIAQNAGLADYREYAFRNR